MRARLLAIALVTTLLGWFQSAGALDEADSLRRRSPRVGPGRVGPAVPTRVGEAAGPGPIGRPSGSPARGCAETGYRASGRFFYTWQEERAEAESWFAALAPADPCGRERSDR